MFQRNTLPVENFILWFVASRRDALWYNSKCTNRSDGTGHHSCIDILPVNCPYGTEDSFRRWLSYEPDVQECDARNDDSSTTIRLINFQMPPASARQNSGCEGRLAVYNCCKIPSGKSLILPYICAICFTRPRGGLKKNNA